MVLHKGDLRVLSESPYNAEPPDIAELIQYPITPIPLIYARNHALTVHVENEREPNIDTYKLKIDGEHVEENEFNLKDTILSFPRKEVVAALNCAGNRRAKMAEKTQRDPEGLMWSEATISNVRWAGLSLCDLLIFSGVSTEIDKWENKHVCFASHAVACEQDSYFGASIPLAKAMDEKGDVILAYEMNGESLTPEHGFPLRVVVPGFSGARWVKTVDSLTISHDESPCFYQRRDYKVLPDNVTSQDMADSQDWWSRVPAMQAVALNSVIAKVEDITLPGLSRDNTVLVKATGYAVSSERITQVDITADEGKTWVPTRITYQEGRWSWALWEGDVNVDRDVSDVDFERGGSKQYGAVQVMRVVQCR
ncbi:hypothetical protein SERLA73DRAFT_181241 [Serpula lacrymans var. lacrymans S7.3]|uniref:Sulfite oxidase n=2 Tax=Serpula lacrymans var. lacrymans TaxID=341189 RepID=F8PXQ5_SERL3|nr:uncharacterized protein SERLADRAFT_467299 [Serpula lacrymans var. lacrymans S7.9]EGN98668.1 hypothetical protein SERLA73DRAFT_181241 [Serpula lacrymans var. lacrymans S7.3]EGO24271.1 hypothetical protein SERLADRAFT_467299 [Serpula lacrymans var. lacrymans S7.9]